MEIRSKRSVFNGGNEIGLGWVEDKIGLRWIGYCKEWV